MQTHRNGMNKDLKAIQHTYDAIAAEFDITRYKPWPQTVEFIDGLPDNSTVLDLGCGNGRNVKYLIQTNRDFKIIGLDFSKPMLRIAKDKVGRLNVDNNVDYIQGDVIRFPINSNSIDGALYVAALHHVPTPELRLASLLELERVLRPGGKGFISVWDFEQERFAKDLDQQLSKPPTDSEFGDVYVPWTGKRGQTYHRFYHLFYRDELKELLAGTGLKLEQVFRASDNYHAIVKKPSDNNNQLSNLGTNAKKNLKTPYELIVERCQKTLQLSPLELKLLPTKWELLGDVLVLKLELALKEYWHKLAEVYAEILGATAVLRRYDKITGTYREPGVELLLGEAGKTETIHTENKVKFKFDPMKVMFSSGNIDERIRISTMAEPNEIVVDMFAGIGYFSLPIAVHSNPKKILACELNPTAYGYLTQNIELNNVTDLIQPVLGDNRECITSGIANRIVMGFIKSEHSHREAALNIVKSTGGIIHFHDVGFKNNVIENALDKVQGSIKDSPFKNKFKAELINHCKIKSYGPKLVHAVLDIEIKQL
jgi:tRNA wybutosine-synthesizing protein 2